MRTFFISLALVSFTFTSAPASAVPVSGFSSDAIAHSGRTNKDGCHHDKKKGTYHCH